MLHFVGRQNADLWNIFFISSKARIKILFRGEFQDLDTTAHTISENVFCHSRLFSLTNQWLPNISIQSFNVPAFKSLWKIFTLSILFCFFYICEVLFLSYLLVKLLEIIFDNFSDWGNNQFVLQISLDSSFTFSGQL